MITLLSPAKKLNMDPAETALDMTKPRFGGDTRALAQVAKEQSVADLQKLMHLSENLASLNVDRFQAFNLDGQSNSAKSAGLAFDGDVYWGLEAKSLSDTELAYAQDHLRILSGLYGLLRPMDAIQPYRLEMGTKLENPRGKNLYQFWDSKIAKTLAEDMADHADKTIVNLASNEYFKAVKKDAINAPVISAKFLNVKDGQARALMYYAKYGRGLMARWIMQNKIDRAEGVKDFNLENYTFDKSLSSESELVFTRPQPPKKK